MLKDGRKLLVKPTKQSSVVNNLPDQVSKYSQLTLELGLAYKNFSECTKVPNRDRMLRTLKIIMMLLKADSFQCKYGDEILRFLVLQCHVLSAQEAHAMFYSMFVNTTGKIDGNIPADLQMEFVVGLYKKHIKHMISNKREINITKRVNALAGLHEVIKNYDTITISNVRSKKHSTASKVEDELSILKDLRLSQPFKVTSGRLLESFSNVESSLLSRLDSSKYIQWLLKRALEHAQSGGIY